MTKTPTTTPAGSSIPQAQVCVNSRINIPTYAEFSKVVPTSDPRELEQGGSTFQTQLDDSQFRANLTERLVTLLGDEAKNPSRQALKTALKFVRRDKEGPLGTSQRDTQVCLLSFGSVCHMY